ncbi:Hcp family type VI secretion system effector [Desulfobaculum sp.]
MQNMFMKIDGIDGESTVKGYEKQIEIYSFSHNFSQPTSPLRSSEGGGTTSRAQHGEFSVSKRTDLSTADLCKALWSGKHISEIVFTACRMDGDDVVAYLVVTMNDVVISNYNISGGGDLPMETFSLNYGKIKYEYKKQKEAGGAEGTKAGMHDLETNQIS